MWRFVEESATLDHNSQYLYLLLADMFSQTSAVAVQNGRIVGLVTAFLVPQRADTLFVYQMRVGVQVRHHKLALTMIDSILARFPDDVRFVEYFNQWLCAAHSKWFFRVFHILLIQK